MEKVSVGGRCSSVNKRMLFGRAEKARKLQANCTNHVEDRPGIGGTCAIVLCSFWAIYARRGYMFAFSLFSLSPAMGERLGKIVAYGSFFVLSLLRSMGRCGWGDECG